MQGVNLRDYKVQPRALVLLSPVLAKNKLAIPLKLKGNELFVAMYDLEDQESFKTLEFFTGKTIIPIQAPKEEILDAIDRFYFRDEQLIESRLEMEIEAEIEKEKDTIKRDTRIISVLSNKGGVGKTHFSINLACQLADEGHKVLLIDCDLGNADISNKLNIFPGKNLIHFLDKQVSLRDIICETDYGFSLIPGASGENRLANMNYMQKMKFIKSFTRVAGDYDYAIFDLQAGIQKIVLDFALAARDTIILTTPHDIIAGYACAKAIFNRYKELELRLEKKKDSYYVPEETFHPFFVVNQIVSERQGRAILQRVSQTIDKQINEKQDRFSIGLDYLGGIAFNKDLYRKAEIAHKPISSLFPKSDPAQHYLNIAKVFLPDRNEELEVKLSPLKRFVRKLKFGFGS